MFVSTSSTYSSGSWYEEVILPSGTGMTSVTIPSTLPITATTTFYITSIISAEGCPGPDLSSCTVDVLSTPPGITVAYDYISSSWDLTSSIDYSITYETGVLVVDAFGVMHVSPWYTGYINPSGSSTLAWTGTGPYYYTTPEVGNWFEIQSITRNDGCSWGVQPPYGANYTLDHTLPTAPRGVNPSLPAQPGGQDNIQVYPNPTSGSFTLELPGKPTGVEVTISDIVGQKMETTIVNANQTQFNLAGYAHGVYFVKIKMNNSTVVKKVTYE